MSANKSILIKPAKFDPKNVVFSPCTVSKKGSGASSTTLHMSDVRYTSDDGELCKPYVVLPPQNSFGVDYVYDITASEGDKVPSNAKGVHLCYNVTSMQTVKQPTEEEAQFMAMCGKMFKCAIECAKKEVSRDPVVIPQASVTPIENAMTKEKAFLKKSKDLPKAEIEAGIMEIWSKAIKPMFSYADKDVKKEKPQRMYIKLVSYGQGEKLSVKTRIFPPKSSEEINYKDIINVRGSVKPVIVWEGMYWGAHGTTGRGASIRVKVHEMIFERAEPLNYERMLNDTDDEDEDIESTNKRISALGLDDDESDPVSAIKKSAPKPSKAAAKIQAAKGKGKAKEESEDEESDKESSSESEEEEPAPKKVIKKKVVAPAPKKIMKKVKDA